MSEWLQIFVLAAVIYSGKALPFYWRFVPRTPLAELALDLMPAGLMTALIYPSALLGAVLTGLGTMIAKNRLPRLHHPLFDAPRFHLASDDRFFVSLALGDHSESDARAMLGRMGAVSVSRVGGELPE